MNEDIFIVIIPRNETISTLHVEPFDFTSYSAGNDVLLLLLFLPLGPLHFLRSGCFFAG